MTTRSLSRAAAVLSSVPPAPAVDLLPVSSIRDNGGTQMRAALNPATVAEYAEAMQAGAAFPALVAYYDGSAYWLADGFHRLAALREVGGGSARVEVRPGTRRDAILHAAGANSDHGLRRSVEDKRRAVDALLSDPEWAAWSDGEIARACRVSRPFAGERRKLHETTAAVAGSIAGAPVLRNYVGAGGAVATMRVGGIADANRERSGNRGGAAGRRFVPAEMTQDEMNAMNRAIVAPAEGASTGNVTSLDPLDAAGAGSAGSASGVCSVCHRPLSDPASVAGGMGPVCAGKHAGALAAEDVGRVDRLAQVRAACVGLLDLLPAYVEVTDDTNSAGAARVAVERLVRRIDAEG